MNENRKLKVSVLRLLAFSLVLCLLAVVVFSFSEIFFERISRKVDPSSDDTKNTRWVLGHAENLLLFPVLALSGLLYGKKEDVRITAVHYREKKIAFSVLFLFLCFVFLPYYASQNMAANVGVFEAIGDKVLWFVTQIIFISSLIMYHSARQERFENMAEEKKEEQDE